MATTLDKVISQGDRLVLSFSSDDVDADTWTWAFALWADPASPLVDVGTADVALVDGTPDTITVIVAAADLASVAPGAYHYHLKSHDGGTGWDLQAQGDVTLLASPIVDQP